jgi:3-phosphoshikimate 1-carboxyvinyltransferase
MSNILIKPSSVSGNLFPPSSKSMMQRAVAALFLSCLDLDNNTIKISSSFNPKNIINPSDCDDALASLRIVEGLIKGEDVLDCGESGLSLRMFAPIVSLFDKELTLTGRGSLLRRPVTMMEDALKELGVFCTSNNGFPPLKIKGPLKAASITIDGSLTSQLITGLLMALPCCKEDSELIIKDLKSRPYVDMTLKLVNEFGIKTEHLKVGKEISNKELDGVTDIFKIVARQKYKSIKYSIEGDWSGASFLLVAGAIAARAGKIRVNNLNYKESLQADKAIIDALRLCGANILLNYEAGWVEVSNSNEKLKAFDFDASDCPDLFPPLLALSVFCDGVSNVKGARRLKHKESNRAKTLYTEFTKLGAKIELLDDLIKITGNPSGIKGGEIDSHNDHRIAMACAVAGLHSKGGVKVNGAECVNKSYPNFFKDLHSLQK